MSPEQVMNRPLDQRCDIWALGVVFAEMLTGVAPFQADSVTAALFSILNETPHGLESVHPDLRPVLYHALAKDPDQRYATCEEFLADLATAEKQMPQKDLEIEPTRELPPSGRRGSSSAGRRRLESQASRWSGGPPWTENRGRKVWVLGAVSCVLAVALAGWFVPPVRERVAALVTGRPAVKRVAVLPFEVIGTNPQGSALADGLMESFTGRLSNLDTGREPLWVVPTSEVRRRHVTEPTQALNLLGANLVIKGTVERNGNDIHLTVNLIDSEKLRQVGSAILDDSAGDLSSLEDQAALRVAKLMNVPVAADAQRENRGKVAGAAYEDYLTALGLMQRWDKPGNLNQAIAVLQNALKTDPEFALGYAQMGEAYRMKSLAEQSPRWVGDAEANAEKAVKINDRIPSAFVTLGRIHTAAGKSDLALDEFQRALKLDPRNADAIAGLGRAYELAGRLSDAEAGFRRAVDLRPDDWNGYNNLAMYLSRHGKYAEAISQFRRALELAPDSAQILLNMGATYIDSGDPKYFSDAESTLKKAIALHPSFAGYVNLGALYTRQGRYQESADLTRKALAMNSENYIVWDNLRLDYAWLKQTDKARDAARHAIPLLEQHVQRSPRDAEAFGLLGDLFALDHVREKALANLRTALALAPDDPGILITAADAYANLGDRGKAIECLRSALKHGASREALASDPDLQALLSDPGVKGQVN
jgi:Flp pilus assembly protein TadD